MSDARAIVFDLDDTIYPYHDFVLSGFRAVARRLAWEHGVNPESVFELLKRARGRGHRGRELQHVCERLGLPASAVPRLVEVIHRHTPALCLPAASAKALRQLRRDWRIGVLTNGIPAIQQRKVEALGLHPLVDAIVYAVRCGGAVAQKPDPRGFRSVLRRLGARAASSVFVGDDPQADIAGAASVGMKTIRVIGNVREREEPRSIVADRCVRTIAAVPRVAAMLAGKRSVRHAA